MALCNESFGATNEREGSEIARQGMIEGEPLQTSYGTDLYDSVFGPERPHSVERRADSMAAVDH